ncbi:MAG: hypothetical protein LBQ06_05435 [Frankiaceae bacterium]|jgi:hypothetical protein|nr:hypothetical protein [Frankiaceae bacterium]
MRQWAPLAAMRLVAVIAYTSYVYSASALALIYPDGREINLWVHSSGCAYVPTGFIRTAGTPLAED